MSEEKIAFMDWATQQFQQKDAVPTARVDDFPTSDEILDARLGRLPMERVQEIIQQTLECPLCAELWRLAVPSFIEDIQRSEELALSSLTKSVAQQEKGGAALLSLREFEARNEQPQQNDSKAPSSSSQNARIRWSWIGATAAVAIALVIVLQPRAPDSQRTLRGGSGSASQRLGKEFRVENGIFRWPSQAKAARYRLEVFDESLQPIFRVSKLTRPSYETTPAQRVALEKVAGFYWSVTIIDDQGTSSTSPTFRGSMAPPQ